MYLTKLTFHQLKRHFFCKETIFTQYQCKARVLTGLDIYICSKASSKNDYWVQSCLHVSKYNAVNKKIFSWNNSISNTIFLHFKQYQKYSCLYLTINTQEVNFSLTKSMHRTGTLENKAPRTQIGLVGRGISRFYLHHYYANNVYLRTLETPENIERSSFTDFIYKSYNDCFFQFRPMIYMCGYLWCFIHQITCFFFHNQHS